MRLIPEQQRAAGNARIGELFTIATSAALLPLSGNDDSGRARLSRHQAATPIATDTGVAIFVLQLKATNTAAVMPWRQLYPRPIACPSSTARGDEESQRTVILALTHPVVIMDLRRNATSPDQSGLPSRDAAYTRSKQQLFVVSRERIDAHASIAVKDISPARVILATIDGGRQCDAVRH